MTRPCLSAAGLCLLLAMPVHAAERYASYDGQAVDLASGTPIYDESHLLRYDGEAVAERVVLYKCPGGAPFARKRMVAGDSPLRPLFELDDARIGYVEGLRRSADGSGLEVYSRRGPEAPVETERLQLPAELVADAGFDEFVRKHWDTLLAGEKVQFDFLVPSRLEYLSFKVRWLREETEDGVPAQVFRLGLSGVLGWVLSGIDVWYASADRLLLRFDGLSNIRGPDTENYKASIRFPQAQRRAEADRTAFDAALAAALVKECSA